MASRYKLFDRKDLRLLPLSSREHDLDLSVIKDLVEVPIVDSSLYEVGTAILNAVKNRAAVVMMLGAHVIRAGVQNYLINLLETNKISCLAVNGAFAIHDFEFAAIGATTESVNRYIQDGKFGLWSDISVLNDIAGEAYQNGIGFGEHIGHYIQNSTFPHKNISVLAAAYRAGIPVTVHLGIGADIIHEHPNCDGAALGGASYTDFLIFTEILKSLSNGVMMTFGSAVMAPEVFLKGLAMARNIASQQGEAISNFTTLVCDLRKLPSTYRIEALKSDPDYFFRPWKTMLVRTQSTVGQSYYVQGDHQDTIPGLWTSLQKEQGKQGDD